MPKIRGVKPEFWTDEDICELSIPARLLFIGMWNFACDNGHLQDKSRQIKMRILPADDVNAADLLREIESRELIERDSGWITIPNLTQHQKPHKRWWATCEMPGCEPPEGTSRAPSNRGATVAQPVATVDHGCATADVDGDVEGDGDGEKKTSSSSGARKRGTRLAEDWIPSENVRVDLAGKFPQVDLKAEHERFLNYWIAKPGKDGTKTDWDRTFRNWISTAAERLPARLNGHRSSTGEDPDAWMQPGYFGGGQ